jgi:xanthine dehydrogenase YagT iron-sulfur-binding subunit
MHCLALQNRTPLRNCRRWQQFIFSQQRRQIAGSCRPPRAASFWKTDMQNSHPPIKMNVTRRTLLSASMSAAGLPLAMGACSSPPSGSENAASAGDSGLMPVKLVVNGSDHHLKLDPRTTLLDALRENLSLTGSKKGCDHGQCGACTVLVGERRVLSCLTLAVAVRDAVTTIEGLAGPGGTLHPMQQAFIDHDAFQCGYCTPGQIMSAVACVAEGHATSDGEIREFMSGNLCRCAAYPQIVAAIQQASSETQRT